MLRWEFTPFIGDPFPFTPVVFTLVGWEKMEREGRVVEKKREGEKGGRERRKERGGREKTRRRNLGRI